MQRSIALMGIGMLLLFSLLPSMAQGADGSGAVQLALTATGQNCGSLSRDQACYGHALLSATPQTGANPFTFDAEGDLVNLSRIQSLKLSGLDVDAGTWGVALMELRANLPSELPGNVTVLAFGDVQMANEVPQPTSAEVQVRTRQYVNVRLGPSAKVGAAGVLAPGQTVTALERLADSSWLRVRLPDSDKTGWVLADLVTSNDNLETLNVADRNSTYYEPMQAFYFQSGADLGTFEQVPESGLLIQTPEGAGEVQLLINEINIQIGSTVYFRAQANGMMTIATLEGHANVTAFGITQTAFGGTQVTVPLNADGMPEAAPNPPVPYDMETMQLLPTGLLKRQIEISPPMTPQEIADMIEQQAILNGESNGTCGGGESCNAPGHGGTCPGGSCDNPGVDQSQGRAQTGSKGKSGK